MSGKNQQNSPRQNNEEKVNKVKEKNKRRIPRKKPMKLESMLQPQINDRSFQWDDQQQFVVERIIREEVWDNKRYYLVKWKGFDISLSTWEEVEKFKNMPDLVNDFARSQKGKRDRTIQQSSDAMMNPYLATEIHGHFLYGDEPDEIVNTFVEYNASGKKTIYLEVSWKNRPISKGQLLCLENSILSSDIIFEHNPKFLLQFYKKNLILKPEN